jgi:hypothetical protein
LCFFLLVFALTGSHSKIAPWRTIYFQIYEKSPLSGFSGRCLWLFAFSPVGGDTNRDGLPWAVSLPPT